VFEQHIRILRRNGIGLVHEAERGGEDDVAAGPCKVFDHRLCTGLLVDILGPGDFHPVTQADFCRLGPKVC
jgi:hypothetical protein